MKAIWKASIFIMLLATGVQSAVFAQQVSTNKKEAKAAAIKNLIEEKSYVFNAQFVSPMTGGTRQLTSPYDVVVSRDTVVSFLPYFGRAYSAPIDPTQGGIQFTSTSFDYNVAPRKKGGWDITIATKDQTDNQRLFLTVYENGSAMLQVTSNNRQPISFNGNITERRPARKK